MIEPLRLLFLREIQSIRDQVNGVPREEDLWACPKGVTNSIGVLTRHLCGNLQHFIGSQLGNTGYVREREAEFAAPPSPRADLLRSVDATERAVDASLRSLHEAHLSGNYPLEPGGFPITTETFLLHLLGHLAYHLGQIDTLRRVLTGDPGSMRMLSIPRLAQE